MTLTDDDIRTDWVRAGGPARAGFSLADDGDSTDGDAGDATDGDGDGTDITLT